MLLTSHSQLAPLNTSRTEAGFPMAGRALADGTPWGAVQRRKISQALGRAADGPRSACVTHKPVSLWVGWTKSLRPQVSQQASSGALYHIHEALLSPP